MISANVMQEIDEVIAFMPTLDRMRGMKFVKAVRKKRRETRRARRMMHQIDGHLLHEWDLEDARARRERLATIEMERLLQLYAPAAHAEAGSD